MSVATRAAIPARQRTGSPDPSPAVDANLMAFLTIADRIEALVEEETTALRNRQGVDFAEVSRRKRQSFLELSRTLPQLMSGGPGPVVRTRLSGLSEKLDRNRAALDIQLRAVREVAGIIERALRDAESDGTYSYAAAWQ